jgi:hypothetical protein
MRSGAPIEIRNRNRIVIQNQLDLVIDIGRMQQLGFELQ